MKRFAIAVMLVFATSSLAFANIGLRLTPDRFVRQYDFQCKKRGLPDRISILRLQKSTFGKSFAKDFGNNLTMTGIVSNDAKNIDAIILLCNNPKPSENTIVRMTKHYRSLIAIFSAHLYEKEQDALLRNLYYSKNGHPNTKKVIVDKDVRYDFSITSSMGYMLVISNENDQ